MITESYYWKKPLLTGAKLIQKYMDMDKISDAQFARIESEIFIGFYSIRKLLEATAKVGAQTRDMKVALKWFGVIIGSTPFHCLCKVFRPIEWKPCLHQWLPDINHGHIDE